jgi:regulator of sirC expression with transglutaminase-like and TPR domain
LRTGVDYINTIQTLYDNDTDELRKERLALILDELKLLKLVNDISFWKENYPSDLLEGLLSIARYGYPNLDVDNIKKEIEDIADVIRKNISDCMTSREIIHLFNQEILYNKGYNGNIKNYSGINNSFINKVMESKISNPIGLSVIYLLVARKLGIQLVGINSPGHFIIGYVESETEKTNLQNWETLTDIAFYIDPFNNGQIVEKDDYKRYLKDNFNLVENEDLTASNTDIVKRVMNNLTYALFHGGEKSTAKKLIDIIDTF